jgi:hypothetical protein
MALRNGQGQRKKYLTLELSSASNFVEDMCAIVSEFQSAKIGAIVHAMLLNDFLRKNAPEVLEGVPRAPSQRQSRVSLARGVTPRWVTLPGLPALTLLLRGIVLIAIAFLVTLLRSGCFAGYEPVTACVCEPQISQGRSHPKTEI